MHLRLFVAASLAIGTTAAAQTPVEWTAKAATKTAAPGTQASVKLSATIEDGWHIYSITQGPGGPFATKITMPTPQSFALGGKIKGSTPEIKFDQNFGMDVETHENRVEYTVPVTVDKAAKAGAQKVQVNVRYQVCNASTCLPPKTEKLTVALTVAGKAATAAPATAAKKRAS